MYPPKLFWFRDELVLSLNIPPLHLNRYSTVQSLSIGFWTNIFEYPVFRSMLLFSISVCECPALLHHNRSSSPPGICVLCRTVENVTLFDCAFLLSMETTKHTQATKGTLYYTKGVIIWWKVIQR